ncbi:MAG: twin-arginine translocase subunit TatC [Neisseriaceae bacterium]|nr:twin-arginine translocase subunit TatC [Neisseriaceae bacterium]
MNEGLLSHLIELRSRLMRVVLLLLLAFGVLYCWSGELFHFFAQPLLAAMPKGGHLIATEVSSSFFVQVQVTFFVAFLVTLPYSLFQFWGFIAPALYQHERQWIIPLLVGSVSLFLMGMAFAYYVIFPIVFVFLNAQTPEGVLMMTDVGEYLSFVMTLFIAFGMSFEVPIVVIVLARLGLVSVAQLKAARPYVVVGIFVLAAVVTPPDIVSQVLLAIPLYLLYEGGMAIAAVWGKKSDRI